MKRILQLMVGCLGMAAAEGSAQVLSLDSTPFLYSTNYSRGVNYRSGRGVPISAITNSPVGSDGRAPAGGTVSQHSGQIAFGAVTRPGATNLVNSGSTTNFAQNAVNLDVPRGTSSGNVVLVLRGNAGAPYFSRASSFSFGQRIPPPITDESGAELPQNQQATYWVAEPDSSTGHAGAPYYWSPHAGQVFATQPGPIQITWRKAAGTTNVLSGLSTNVGGFNYRQTNATYVVAGSAAKTPRKLYWTERTFRALGKPVQVPAAQVRTLFFAYNDAFPKQVEQEYVAPGESQVATNALKETRSIWYDTDQHQILAYNREGRVFMELLGDVVAGSTRQHLGYEIVDVYKEVAPASVTVELGEELTPYTGRADPALSPERVLGGDLTKSFVYQQLGGGADIRYHATRVTENQNDLLMHWMEVGAQGLRWPFLLTRYQLIWPTDPVRYTHYLRPLVATEAQAKETAVALPTENAPFLEYQDPLDQPRGKLTAEFRYYSFLEPRYPVHRALLRFISGDHLRFERVYSSLSTTLIGQVPAIAEDQDEAVLPPEVGLLVNTNSVDGLDRATLPRYVSRTAMVGDRISAPSGELGGNNGGSYHAGFIQVAAGNSYHATAYQDPFVAGFEAANLGSIIPVNAIPGNNQLEVWWFRKNQVDEAKGFKPVYWPSVIGRYTLGWPGNTTNEIVLASNDGSGALDSLQAKGTLYTQNDATKHGYNPNEEHAVMIGGQAYALRDDLNLTGETVPAQLIGAGATYSSDRFVLLSYTAADGRPAVRAFQVLREKPLAGVVFDYPVAAGTMLQAPMPLPFLAPPIETVTNGTGTNTTYTNVNYNKEPANTAGDLPGGWNPASDPSGPLAHYAKFTFLDRKQAFWVMRGVHAGQPTLRAGTYSTNTSSFATNLSAATAIEGQPFTNLFHTSRRPESLTLSVHSNSPALPTGISINGLALVGTPPIGATSSNLYTFVIKDEDDGVSVINTLSLKVLASGGVVSQGPLTVQSTNQYALNVTTLVGRPPYLAEPAAGSNSFQMQFYYKTQAGFAWPGLAAAPAVGAIVPYLRPLNADGQYVGARESKTTDALKVVYRSYWPGNPPKLAFGETLTVPKNGLPAVRGQTSVQVLYQQSIGQNLTNNRASVVLHDPTREKTYALATNTMSKLPDGVRAEVYQGKTFFPNLPPHLAQRFFLDPNRGALGSLVFKGEFKDELVGEKYLLLNVLRDSDLATVKALCPASPTDDKQKWDAAINGLATTVETFHENPKVPGTYVVNTDLSVNVGVGDLAGVNHHDTAVDSYALSAAGPGAGYVTLVVGGGEAFTPKGEPVSVYVLRVTGSLYKGEIKILPSANPLNELISFQHTADLGGRFADYEYEWRINPPVDGQPPTGDPTNSYTLLTSGTGVPRYTLGGAGIQALVDNWLVLRYRPKNTSHPLYNQWSDWTPPQLAEGWIKRVLAGINPFNQRVSDLNNNTVNTDANILTSAGRRYEGDIALNLENINNYGLIEIYETVLKRGRNLSIDAGINFGPANDALLLAAGYLNDLYFLVGNEASSDAANPTIGIGTKDKTYGDIATALFAFKGQMPSLLEEELALLRGRDDVLQPGVTTAPVYNRLFWNYTRGIDAGEVIYALNYNILDQNTDGKADAADAAKLYPQGHGDAYGHYLTATKGYYSLLMNNKFDWVPRVEAVTVLGKPVTVDYLDERKFAAAGAATARTGRQIFDLTWRKDYVPGRELGWDRFSTNRVSTRDMVEGANTSKIVRHWGADQWASRTGQGAFFNWVIGNAILPDVDPDPSHEGIQKIDRTTVPELTELATTAADLQTAMDGAEGRQTPLGLSEGSLAFDINPNTVVGVNPQPHFEQIYDRAKVALNNALVAFDDAKDVTRLMRSEQDSLADLRASVDRQELAYTNALIELYGTPYPDDVGPGKTWKTGYAGPDMLHYMYVELPELNSIPALWNYPGSYSNKIETFKVDVADLPKDWRDNVGYESLELPMQDAPDYKRGEHYIEYELAPHGFTKPATWAGRRASPGKLQAAISQQIAAFYKLRQALHDQAAAKASLDRWLRLDKAKQDALAQIEEINTGISDRNEVMAKVETANDKINEFAEAAKASAEDASDAVQEALPRSLIAGLAAGGDMTSPARGALQTAKAVAKALAIQSIAIRNAIVKASRLVNDLLNEYETDKAGDLASSIEARQELIQLGNLVEGLQTKLGTINEALRAYEDARQGVAAARAQGDRILQEREMFRQRSAAVVQGFRTRDAAFRIFRNEKLERYNALFDLAARYAYLAANAYDYETGLLNTPKGKTFVNRIVNSRALGVVRDGEPQFAGSNTGDPGLSSALTEMKADWDVLKGRLGFNNPDAYGTTVSLRTEALRILPGTDGNPTWQDALQAARKVNILDDADVRRYCLQVDPGNGLPVPGIVIEFSTTIANGYNLFGKPLAAGDSDFSPSRFATKLYGAGVALIGYRGMSDPAANSGAVSGSGGTSPADPVWYLDPKALAATPDIYLIPVGVDSMRSPPLGDVSTIRSWSVDDVTVPLPFNIGGSDFSIKPVYQSSDSLTEALFGIRKHQSFRPVSTTAAFAGNIYSATGSLQPSQYTNRRLIGRSVWNSKWKLVIPGYELLNNPNEGLDRFIQTVTDVKLHLVTYSYSGN